MRRKKIRFITCFLLLPILFMPFSCATDMAQLKIENSLPQDELAYYSDPFDCTVRRAGRGDPSRPLSYGDNHYFSKRTDILF
jgi:hypothetical protein